MKKPLAVIGLLLGLVIALTGCVKMNIDIVIKDQDTADISMVMAFKQEVLQGKSVEEFLGTMGVDDPFADMPADAKREEYNQDGFQGYRVVLNDQKLTDSGVPGVDGITQDSGLEYADGKYTFHAPIESGNEAGKEAITESTMSITFPGKVLEASEGAIIEGNKVSFDMLTASGTEVSAVAEGKPAGIAGQFSGSSMGWIWWVLGGLILVAGALVAFLVIYQRRNAVAAAAASPAYPVPTGDSGQETMRFAEPGWAAGQAQSQAPMPPMPPMPPAPPAPPA
ncbi:LppM family (lipo)protein [Paeniglutamicibacter cryotolerans]|uniref:LppM domain-containing protein n=1 Tax=Paeniglutamicibacter cryotolerans TaxID=670079 RepID=A0A839QSH4_9MICC|nr:hypothetical protein [Paeniglutamicibacter cryotolerans]MBB2996212.1 hypothetical protein [Paeniglutamicibacter cryotolerans]